MDEFEARALSGDCRAASAALSLAAVSPDIVAALRTHDAHMEVVSACSAAGV
ncbi:hypothetical protein [Paenarthrobacter sp. NPDC058040]|uniref:hypothetical protein n=1 Tax=unclassified Paenarthrobacter TaxID=2634190 RepID=UPI0036DF8CFF